MSGYITPQDLNIDLTKHSELQLFKWLLACLLFGKPIQQEVAARTFRVFEDHGFTSPEAILDASWDTLVKLMGEGHYVRFDYSTSTKLQEVMMQLKTEYGTVTNLIEASPTTNDLKKNLLAIKNIGPKTADIFIRDVEPVWYKKQG